MENETAIEKSIKQFVYTKIQEQVYLDVSKRGIISIRHRSKHGSIALAMFWLRVLRHQNNYPMPKYPYKDLYDKQGNNKIILIVDSVTMTTFMSTGTLMIQGVFVLEWFLNTFPAILDAYDAPIHEPQPKSTIYTQYTENWKKLEQYYAEKKEGEEAEERAREEAALAIVGDRENIISLIRQNEQDTAPNTANTTDMRAEHDEPLSSRLQQAADLVAEELEDTQELLALDVWPADTVQEQLTKLQNCCVRSGPAYIYPLWKSLLHHWFSDPGRRLYIVTPFLDAHRLGDVCHIILEHRLTANLDCFLVRQTCNHERKIFEVKQKALSQFGAKDQMFLEYKIYSSIIYPVKNFHASFVASVKGDEAEVLVTSASFHGDHFELDNLDTVQYQTMSETDFTLRFLGPLTASVQAK